jgi:hypothetical protein
MLFILYCNSAILENIFFIASTFPIAIFNNRVVRKLQVSEKLPLENAKCVSFCKTWATTNQVGEQVQYLANCFFANSKNMAYNVPAIARSAY